MCFSEKRTLLCVGVLLAMLVISLSVASGASATGTVGWTVHAAAEPSNFSTNDALRCESEGKCDRYQLLVTNVGDEPSSGPVTLTDRLPPGIKLTKEPESGTTSEGAHWGCTENEGTPEQWTVTCEFAKSVPAGGYAPFLKLEVSAPTAAMSGSLKNEVSVTGGGAAAVAGMIEETPISSRAPEFGVSDFGFEADGVDGTTNSQADAHPWEVTTAFSIPTIDSPPGIGAGEHFIVAVENVKDAIAELPAGFVGDPQAAPQCTQTELRTKACPGGSLVGAIALRAGVFGQGEFIATGNPNGCCSAVYNIVPERGYPAEFGFTFAGLPVYLYATVVHGSSGYHLRITAPGIPAEL